VVDWNDLNTGLDAIGFARRRLDFEPDRLQAEMLTSRAKWLLLNSSRQWGRSTLPAIAALHRVPKDCQNAEPVLVGKCGESDLFQDEKGLSCYHKCPRSRVDRSVRESGGA